MGSSIFEMSSRNRAVFWAACGVLALVLLFRAWVDEDAYITARVIDNLLHGYGLRWNVDERVQVFTHPLWLFLLVPFVRLSGEFFFTTIAVSLTVASAAIWILVRTLKLSHGASASLIIGPLILSRVFTDFATSGLEIALTCLIASAFLSQLVSSPERPRWLRLGLLASLAATNRLDTLLLFLPPLAYLCLTHRKTMPWWRFLAGLAPLVTWELFSLLYFGSLFPNTKYAKLNTGLPLAGQLKRGVQYLLDFVVFDLASAIMILAALALAFSLAGGRLVRDEFERVCQMLACGVLAYIGYTVAIGGDFMAGRFFAAPFFVALFVVAVLSSRRPAGLRWLLPLLIIGCTLSTARILSATPNVFTRPFDGDAFVSPRTGIDDERAWCWQTNHLLSFEFLNRGKRVEDHPFSELGKAWRIAAQDCGSPPCAFHEAAAIGMTGYYAGPNVAIVDVLALADPLLARLPASGLYFNEPGHYLRKLPPGYMLARRTGSLAGMEPSLARYYEPLRLVTRGDLFDLERLKAIVRLNVNSPPS